MHLVEAVILLGMNRPVPQLLWLLAQATPDAGAPTEPLHRGLLSTAKAPPKWPASRAHEPRDATPNNSEVDHAEEDALLAVAGATSGDVALLLGWPTVHAEADRGVGGLAGPRCRDAPARRLGAAFGLQPSRINAERVTDVLSLVRMRATGDDFVRERFEEVCARLAGSDKQPATLLCGVVSLATFARDQPSLRRLLALTPPGSTSKSATKRVKKEPTAQQQQPQQQHLTPPSAFESWLSGQLHAMLNHAPRPKTLPERPRALRLSAPRALDADAIAPCPKCTGKKLQRSRRCVPQAGRVDSPTPIELFSELRDVASYAPETAVAQALIVEAAGIQFSVRAFMALQIPDDQL